MEKKLWLCLTLFILFTSFTAGCSVGKEKFETYLNEPKYFIQDPHFAKYQEKRDALESEYLQKKITYAQYIERKDQLDEEYTKEVEERNAIINPAESE